MCTASSHALRHGMGQQLQILQWIMTIMDHNHYETAQTPSNWDMWVSASNVHGDYAAGQGHSRQYGWRFPPRSE